MSAQVDVLADLRDLAERNHLSGRGDSERSIREIHDAVKELMEATEEAERRITYMNIKDGKLVDANLVIRLRSALRGCGK